MKKLFLSLVLFSSFAFADVQNRFGPVDGILVGDDTSYQTTAAESSDVISLWSGTCSATTFLRGDGSCQVAAQLGVANTWTAAQRFSGTANPISFNASDSVGDAYIQAYSSDGTTERWYIGNVDSSVNTLTIANEISNSHFNLGTSGTGEVQVNGQNIRNTGILTSGTLGVTRGGTGTTTSTGTGSVVLSASPTLTGTVTAATVAATTVTVGGQNVCQANGTNCPASSGTPGGSTTQVQFNNAGAFGGDAGMTYNSGTDSLSVTGTVTAATLTATAATVGGSAVCRADGTNCPAAALTETKSSYTATAVGCTTSPTYSIEYVKIGNIVSLYIPATSCTSNATTFTLTGAPAAIRPGAAIGSATLSAYTNNGTLSANGLASMGTDGTLTIGFFHATNFFASWTNSGTKGTSASVMTYILR